MTGTGPTDWPHTPAIESISIRTPERQPDGIVRLHVQIGDEVITIKMSGAVAQDWGRLLIKNGAIAEDRLRDVTKP